jgi:hypothetical protein
MRERGIDLAIFSPRASFMAHHVGDFQVSSAWAATCNELCFRVSRLFPDHFVPAAMLPQNPGVDPATCMIGYSTGPSGSYLVGLLERWGVAVDVASRLVQAPPGVPVATLIARGEVDLGFQQLSELLHAPGVDVVGRLPSGIRHTTIFTGAVCTAAAHAQAAATLLAFLASGAGDEARRRHGLEPAC